MSKKTMENNAFPLVPVDWFLLEFPAQFPHSIAHSLTARADHTGTPHKQNRAWVVHRQDGRLGYPSGIFLEL
jgi:hypothetical protein